jgi:hypothetical protein
MALPPPEGTPARMIATDQSSEREDRHISDTLNSGWESIPEMI